MGNLRLDNLVSFLNANGVRSEEAYPGKAITRIVSPVAALSVDCVNQENRTITVLAEILSPQDEGGYPCQEKAMDVCNILSQAGGICRTGSCQFLNKAGVFRVPVWAVFHMDDTLPYTLRTGTLLLPYACGFSAYQETDKTITSIHDAPWVFTVEELFPWGVMDTMEVQEPFELILHRSAGNEEYTGCVWTKRKRIAEKDGIRQIREGISNKRFLTSGDE
ncbi:MAG: hypothetical protein E7462_02195 [Ruminococcaceae bacterium]|nr:hypothetical protein [Oscillospiraceae bacterium]